MRTFVYAAALVVGSALALPAVAYDGQKCKAPGNCWEPKPGFPDKVAGSKYDPKHDPRELSKQSESIKQMEERNKQRVENAKKSGKFEYDIGKFSSAN